MARRRQYSKEVVYRNLKGARRNAEAPASSKSKMYSKNCTRAQTAFVVGTLGFGCGVLIVILTYYSLPCYLVLLTCIFRGRIAVGARMYGAELMNM